MVKYEFKKKATPEKIAKIIHKKLETLGRRECNKCKSFACDCQTLLEDFAV